MCEASREVIGFCGETEYAKIGVQIVGAKMTRLDRNWGRLPCVLLLKDSINCLVDTCSC